MKEMLCKQNSAAMFHVSPALADESGLRRNCAEAAGLPPTTQGTKKGLT
jgi:hypothetical protein